MEKEKCAALDNLRKELENVNQKIISEIKQDHLKEIEELNDKMKEQKLVNDNLRTVILEQEALWTKTEDRLKEVLESFQGFINTVPGFSEGQADFLLKDFLPPESS